MERLRMVNTATALQGSCSVTIITALILCF